MWGRPPITFVNGRVVGDGAIFESIRIRGSSIDRLGAPPSRGDTVIDLDGACVFPGLINAHDHLELNSFTRLKWRERYDNVREWIADFQPRFAADPDLAAARPETLADRVWVGGLKNLLAGVTTVCHHNPIHRPLRRRFPVRIVRRFGLSHSLQIDGASVAAAYRATPPDWPWVIHAAEGVDDEARGEVSRLAEMGCLGANTVLVHGVALTAADGERVLASGGALIWCPGSNAFLFGRTAEVSSFDRDQRLAIGSDSRLSGESDLLEELRTARRTGQVSNVSLVNAVTRGAATILRLPSAGRLVPGAPADLIVVPPLSADPYESLLSARRRDMRLTMIDGLPLVADEQLASMFATCAEPCVPARVDGRSRWIAAWVAHQTTKLRLGEPGLDIDGHGRAH